MQRRRTTFVLRYGEEEQDHRSTRGTLTHALYETKPSLPHHTMTLLIHPAHNSSPPHLDSKWQRTCRWVLHIVDTDPFSLSKGGWLEDVNLVEKYKISDESYNKREHTYRKFKADKLKEDPGWTIEKEMAKKRGVEYVPAYNEVRQGKEHIRIIYHTHSPAPGSIRGFSRTH
jgi:hypothetical protein